MSLREAEIQRKESEIKGKDAEIVVKQEEIERLKRESEEFWMHSFRTMRLPAAAAEKNGTAVPPIPDFT